MVEHVNGGSPRDWLTLNPAIPRQSAVAAPATLEPPPWPRLAPEAMYGIAGEIVAAATANSEADPAAVLATLLAHAGIFAGRGPCIRIGDDFHHARLFAVIVGQSARGRKGTSEKPIRRIGERAAELIGDALNWQPGPLSTGEGLAFAIRDGDGQEDGDPGVADKRLLIVEGEFAAPLRAMQRAGNTLSTALRSAWDGATIAPMTKTARVVASKPHVGIVAHITKAELKELLSRVDIFNGFANRFLWWCARRSKVVPLARGMSAAHVERLATVYAQRIDAAKRFGEVQISNDAEALYRGLYDDLTEERAGLHAVVTARAEAQVIRLALTYAVLDGSPVITSAHMTAAAAIWNYCDDSAAYLFGQAEANPIEQRIVTVLGKGALTTTELHNALGRHTPGETLRTALENLEARGRLDRVRHQTGGRPRETWTLRQGSGACEFAKNAN